MAKFDPETMLELEFNNERGVTFSMPREFFELVETAIEQKNYRDALEGAQVSLSLGHGSSALRDIRRVVYIENPPCKPKQ